MPETNSAETKLTPIEFDATLSVLKLPLGDIQKLAGYKADLAMTQHFTPPHIHGKACLISGVEKSVLDFFDVEKSDYITKEMVGEARQAHGVLTPKTYKVTTDRVETRRLTTYLSRAHLH